MVKMRSSFPAQAARNKGGTQASSRKPRFRRSGDACARRSESAAAERPASSITLIRNTHRKDWIRGLTQREDHVVSEGDHHERVHREDVHHGEEHDEQLHEHGPRGSSCHEGERHTRKSDENGPTRTGKKVPKAAGQDSPCAAAAAAACAAALAAASAAGPGGSEGSGGSDGGDGPTLPQPPSRPVYVDQLSVASGSVLGLASTQDSIHEATT